MIPELQGYALMLRTSHRLLHKALEGVTPEQAAERRDGANSIRWVAAHTVSVRAAFLRGLGVKTNHPWLKQFPRGGRPEDVTEWPSLAQALAVWDEVHHAFMAKLDVLTAEQLAEKTAVPGLDDTLLGMLGLACLHDAYHVGQLSAARRTFGLDRVVG